MACLACTTVNCGKDNAPKPTPAQPPSTQTPAGADSPGKTTHGFKAINPPKSTLKLKGHTITPAHPAHAALSWDGNGDQKPDLLLLTRDPEGPTYLTFVGQAQTGFDAPIPLLQLPLENGDHIETLKVRLRSSSQQHIVFSIDSKNDTEQGIHRHLIALAQAVPPQVIGTLHWKQHWAGARRLAVTVRPLNTDNTGKHHTEQLELVATSTKDTPYPVRWVWNGNTHNVGDALKAHGASVYADWKATTIGEDEKLEPLQSRFETFREVTQFLCGESTEQLTVATSPAAGLGCDATSTIQWTHAMESKIAWQFGRTKAPRDPELVLDWLLRYHEKSVAGEADAQLDVLKGFMEYELKRLTERPLRVETIHPNDSTHQSPFKAVPSLPIHRPTFHYNPSGKLQVTAESPESLWFTSPDQTKALIGLRRKCDNTALTTTPVRILRTHVPNRGRELMLEVFRAGVTQCPRTGRNIVPVAHGWSILGWLPEGIVATRMSQARILPTTAQGHADGPAKQLQPTEPLPAGLSHPASTPNGHVHTQTTPWGILVVYRFHETHMRIIQPRDWTKNLTHPVTQLAIHPHATHITYLQNNTLKELVLQ